MDLPLIPRCKLSLTVTCRLNRRQGVWRSHRRALHKGNPEAAMAKSTGLQASDAVHSH